MEHSHHSQSSKNESLEVRIIEFPRCKYTSNFHSGIERIILTALETRIELVHIATPYHPTGGFLQIDPETYIRAIGSPKRYKLLQTQNIPQKPDKYLFQCKGQVHHFALVFEPIPLKTKQMDLIERLDNGTYHNFLGITLKKSLPQSIHTQNPN